MAKRKSRPDLVRTLSELWKSHFSKEKYLRSVEIRGEQKLRGIKDSCLEFKFPITVLCGPNSTGKTTFLALSALAFHDKASLTLSNSPSRGSRIHYDFSYFFGFSEKEKHPAGIKIRWEYTDGTNVDVEKGAERWMRYVKKDGSPRRPERGVEFVGLSRIIPAFEKRGYSKAFRDPKTHKAKSAVEKLSTYIGRIMGRPYQSIESFEAINSKGSYRLNNYNSTHTSFNAGAGEECLTYIVDTLLSAKDGSFVAIEEIEIGLHPATMERLVDVMMEICIEKKLQLLITTHSPDFLRSCPKESLVLAEREDKGVLFTHMPNVENAVGSVTGKTSPDLFVVCEDELAAEFIQVGLTKKQRDIVNVYGYGGKTELVSKAEVIRSVHNKNVLVVWDADVSASSVKKPESDSGISWAKLPGTKPPEQFIIDLIKSEEIKNQVSEEFGLLNPDWLNLKNAVSALADHHDLPYQLSEHLRPSQNNSAALMRNIVKIVYRARKDDFTELLQQIDRLIHPVKAAA